MGAKACLLNNLHRWLPEAANTSFGPSGSLPQFEFIACTSTSKCTRHGVQVHRSGAEAPLSQFTNGPCTWLCHKRCGPACKGAKAMAQVSHVHEYLLTFPWCNCQRHGVGEPHCGESTANGGPLHWKFKIALTSGEKEMWFDKCATNVSRFTSTPAPRCGRCCTVLPRGGDACKTQGCNSKVQKWTEQNFSQAVPPPLEYRLSHHDVARLEGPNVLKNLEKQPFLFYQ